MSEKKQTVAVIGLGSMGLGMAKSLHRAGFNIRGFDLNPEALQKLAEAGGTKTASPSEAASGADVIVVVVVNAAQTREALFGAEGAAKGARPGAVVLSSATMSPDDARHLAADAEAHGLDYIDAPVSGGPAKAADGRLTIMASGTQQAFAKANATLDAMSETLHRLGDEAGTGAAFKMVNQLLAGVHIAAACEAMSLAAKLGLDLEKVYEVIVGAAGNSWMFESRVPHILAGDYQPLSAVNIFTKDLGIISDMGRKEQFPMPVAATALQQFIATAAAGMGRDDDTSIIRMIAGITGITLPHGE